MTATDKLRERHDIELKILELIRDLPLEKVLAMLNAVAAAVGEAAKD